MSYNYDNWERLVRAALRREEFRYLAMLSDLASDSSTSNSGSSGSPSLRMCSSFFLDQSSIQGKIRNSSSRTREWIRRSYSRQENDFVGLNEDTEKLVAQLVNENVANCSHVVSIIGKGGLGKTALARRIYHHRDVRSHFRSFAWVIISREWQPEEVLQKIIYKLVPEKREQISRMGNIVELINQLFEVQKAKKCLVVLDNVCGTDVWETVRHAFLARKSRSKILFTTRVKEIARHIDTDTTCYFYEQRHLNEEESWELLQRQASFLNNIAGENEYASGSYLEDRSTFSSYSFRSCDTPLSDDGIEDEAADMKELGKEMVGLCAGLPLAIVQLGKILMTKSTLSEWKAVHQSFTSYLMERRNGDNGRFYEAFTLSYHDLPYQTKQCFWYLGKFPKYYKFPVRKLYQLWAAEGFILSDSHPCEENESITDVAERHLSILEQSGMVQVHMDESKECLKYCQLHDFVREICILEGNEIRKRIPESTLTRSGATSIPVDSCTEMIVISEQDNVNHVRSAFVLDLEGFDFVEEMCEYIDKFVHLKYLSLRGSRITKLPSSIDNLKFLQTLDLRVAKDSWLSIPDVLSKLNHLRHLYLPLQQSCTNKLQLSSLQDLETLKNFDPKVSDFRDIQMMNKLKKLTVIFCGEKKHVKTIINDYLKINSNLITNSSFCIHYNFVSKRELTLFEKVVGFLHLWKLDLVGQIEKLPKHFHFSERLTKLTLRKSFLKDDPLAILQKLPNLYSLTLCNNAYVGSRIRCSAGWFCQLRTIELQGLDILEDWIIEEGSMLNLKRIKIDECIKLKRLPEGIKFLGSIRKIEIANMPKIFKQIVDQQAGGNNLHKVVFSVTNQNSRSESKLEQGVGSDKAGLLRSFSPSIPREWQVNR